MGKTMDTHLSNFYNQASKISPNAVMEQLADKGLVVFPKHCLSEQDFSDFADKFSKCYLDSPFGDRKTMPGNSKLQSVSIGSHPIDFHFEWGNLPFRPELLMFCCMEPPISHGETLLCDSSEVIKELSPDSLAALANNKLKYIDMFPQWVINYYTANVNLNNYFNGGFLQYLQALPNYKIAKLNDDFMRTEFNTSAISKSFFSKEKKVLGANILTSIYGKSNNEDSYASNLTFDTGEEIPESIQNEIKQAMTKHQLAVKWQKGDVVLIDNTRFLHGRNAVLDSQRKILLLSAYTKNKVITH